MPTLGGGATGPTSSGTAGGGTGGGTGAGTGSNGSLPTVLPSGRRTTPLSHFSRVRLLAGGTYTAGASEDWSVQFDTSSDATFFTPCYCGEVNLATFLNGVGACVDYAFKADTPYDTQLWVEADTGSEVQVHLNGLITEVAVPGFVSLSVVAGFNLLRVIRSIGPVIAYGIVFDGKGVTSRWVSLYPQGSDPLG